MICSTVKRFLGISAPFTMDPETKYLTQQMDPVKGGRSGAAADISRKIYGSDVQIIEISPKFTPPILQAFSTALSDTTLKDSANRVAEGVVRATTISKIVSIIAAALEEGDDVVIVGSKKIIKLIDGYGLLKGTRLMHFASGTIGIEFSSANRLIVIGRNQPPPKAVEGYARALYADDEKPLELLNSNYVREPRGFRMKSGAQFGVEAWVHSDPRCQEILEQFRERETERIIDVFADGPIRRSKKIFLLCNVPLDISLDHIASLDDLAGTENRLGEVARLSRVYTRKGVLPFSPRDLCNIATDHFPSRDNAKDALATARKMMREQIAYIPRIAELNGGRNLICLLFEFAPHLSVAIVEYRIRGQRGKPSVALVNLQHHEDAREGLECVLGENVTYFCILETYSRRDRPTLALDDLLDGKFNSEEL